MYVLILALFLQTSTSDQTVDVTFRVQAEVPANSDTVHIIGSHPKLGSWDHRHSLRLERLAEGTWQGTVHLPRGIDTAIKVTRGSWFSEAVTPDGAVPPDTWIHIYGDTTLAIIVDRWKDEPEKHLSTVNGILRLHDDFPSSFLGTSRDIWVILPGSYEHELYKRYPVLYVHDGQNVFDELLSYSGSEWRLDETADSLARAGVIPEIMIVAVQSTPNRIYEYADTTLGDLYSRFMAEELKPFIDKTYRTLPDREFTAVIGSSMGALISFLMVWHYPEIYGQAACLSPAFVWGDGKVMRRVNEEPPPQPRPRIFIDTGDMGVDHDLLPGAEQMAELLASKGWVNENDLVLRIHTGSGHNEGDWADRSVEALSYLFSPHEDIDVYKKGESGD